MRKRPLLQFACVFLTGLVYQRYSYKIVLIVCVLSVLWEYRIGRKSQNLRRMAGRSILLLSAFFLGVFHMWQECEFRAAYMSKIADGSWVTVWGELIKWESTEYGYRGILSDCYINFGEGAMPCNDIMVYTSNDQYENGQIHKITGKVNMFSKARNEGNFDAFVYYQSLKTDFAVNAEEIEVLEEEASRTKAVLYSLREQISEVYKNGMPKKAAGFYQAMVLGEKENLEETLKELFLIGGISHILAISGLHVSILGRGLYRILRRGGIGFGVAGICGSIGLICYCIMVGSSTSTVRAVGMLLFFFLAQWIGRSYDMLNALGGMVLFLLWENPFLIENSGFWFSVTALIGVGVVGKAFSSSREEARDKKAKKRVLFDGSGLWMSLGITLTTLPVTALSYYEVPMYSVLVNFIVLPFLTPVFCLAVLGGLFGVWGLSQSVITCLFAPCQWLLAFYEWVCGMASRLPYATIICGKPELWQVILYYFILFGGIYLLHNVQTEDETMKFAAGQNTSNRESLNRETSNKRKRMFVILGIIVICVACIFFPKSQNFEITFLDVGQGDGIYISGGDGTTYFIDGGSSSINKVGENRILPFLKSKQVTTIDYWFVSHCDTDHISGLLEILEKGYKVEHIVLYEHSSDNENYLNLIKKADKVGTEVIYMKAGDKVCSRDLEILCLAPDAGVLGSEDINENSLVLQVEWKQKNQPKEFSALFAGDISIEVENALCESGLLDDVDLVKANHHGSNYSNGELWFNVLSPEYIVVSCSATNLYGHPGVEAVERMEASGAQIFYTMDGGQITFPLIQ